MSQFVFYQNVQELVSISYAIRLLFSYDYEHFVIFKMYCKIFMSKYFTYFLFNFEDNLSN